ncbi:hypothetical protein Sjap_024222 [Stephania japonica]|uniref:Phloem protein 2 n=1 Tax=Stephania japonica TaxID=461633 RepID=A0AAP0ED12_9MAGN
MATNQEAVSVWLSAMGLNGSDKRLWKWSFLPESPTSKTLIETAELGMVRLLELDGAIEISLLTEGKKYEVWFQVMLTNDASEWEQPVTLEMELPEKTMKRNKMSLKDLQRDVWKDVFVGDFIYSNYPPGYLKFYFLAGFDVEPIWKTGLIVKGALIKPKNN